MSYGSAPFGSSALAGLPAAEQLFFRLLDDLPLGSTQRSAEYTGSAAFYAVRLVMESTSDPPNREVRIYSHNDPSETPQLVRTMGEAFFSEAIIGAARFIVVEVEQFDDLSTLGMQISGREYFQ